MDLGDIGLFVRIVELGTLSAAARERNVPVSQVTRTLARLEAQAGVRLLHRSTHGLSLTDEGDAFLAHARRLVETDELLRSELADKRAGPSGWVRVSVSAVVAQAVIAPSLPALLDRHPQLHVEIAADDRVVDMARQGIDLAIRTGEGIDETLVARRIGALQRRLYAAPSYAARRGLPRTVDELATHRLVGNSARPSLNQWQVAEGGVVRNVAVHGDVRADNTAVVLALVQSGVGIGRIVTIAAEPLVAAGALVPVLPGLAAEPPVPVHAVMLPERQRLPKLRACIDYWAEWLARCAAA